IGLGLIIFFIGLFAFWCTLKGHIALLYVYSSVVFLIFVAEILLAVTVLMKQKTCTPKNNIYFLNHSFPKKETSNLPESK
ncbi:unnamed protein product, partial [Adineta steineri]